MPDSVTQIHGGSLLRVATVAVDGYTGAVEDFGLTLAQVPGGDGVMVLPAVSSGQKTVSTTPNCPIQSLLSPDTPPVRHGNGVKFITLARAGLKQPTGQFLMRNGNLVVRAIARVAPGVKSWVALTSATVFVDSPSGGFRTVPMKVNSLHTSATVDFELVPGEQPGIQGCGKHVVRTSVRR